MTDKRKRQKMTARKGGSRVVNAGAEQQNRPKKTEKAKEKANADNA